MEVDISKPLKMEIKYKRGNKLKTALVDYENLTDICYGCGLQDHEFENCPLFPKSFSIKGEKRASDFSLHKDFIGDTNKSCLENENWMEIKPKRRQGPNMGKNLHGTSKDPHAGTREKEVKGKEQGMSTKELPSRPLDAVEPVGGHKGQKVSR